MSSIADGLPAEVHRKIVDAFETFDHEHNKTVDMREEMLKDFQCSREVNKYVGEKSAQGCVTPTNITQPL